jgi:ribosome-binding protein aMBF1 (putative translation factor)
MPPQRVVATSPFAQTEKPIKVKETVDPDDIQKVRMVTSAQSTKLKQARQILQITQKDFATKVNLSTSVIAAYEDGSAVFNQSEWDKINSLISSINNPQASLKKSVRK